MNYDLSENISSQIVEANATRKPLRITAGGSKAFYGNTVQGCPLDVSGHRGVVDYQPEELVLTARCGTPLEEIETALASEGQMLAFEPPILGPRSTFGGAIATGLSGPRRPFTGAARDFVLGTRIINGRGEVLKFGGQVMKNVAGYDVSRLMTGAQGMLGVILDISVKVLPHPECELTLVFECDQSVAQAKLTEWIGQGIPVSASCFCEGQLYIRISNTESSVKAARARVGGEVADPLIWVRLRNQKDGFFRSEQLWRLSLPPAADLNLNIHIIEWAGAQRWVVSEQPLYELAASYGGHATRYDYDEGIEDRFQPLPPTLLALHRRIKYAFDPNGILNPGRLYRGLS